ncbi:MAG: carbohydrate ABC transporter substrate-binding protein [Lentisphaerae bacterium]|nr:carbohydrate ABC transporter substrate-binding protein [Lentisphaerota bacterium]
MSLRWFIGFVLCGVLAVSGCRRDVGPVTVEFWTTDHEVDRIEVQRRLARRFEADHPGVQVRVIGVPENDLPKRLAAYRAGGRLPQVIRLGLEYAGGYADEGILDPDAASTVIRELGEETFFSGPLDLLRRKDGRYAAVPVDGWVQCLWYRKDLFEENGLPPPDTWENILAAARKMHRPQERSYGIVLGTDPQQVYTHQSFEHFALSGGVTLFDAQGNVSIDGVTLQIVLGVYAELAKTGPPENCDWRQARKYYLSGRTAMMLYSPYIIDDIAGLVADQEPIEGLAHNTDFVSVIRGANGKEASYGQVVSLGITTSEDPRQAEGAREWVAFLLSDGYLELCFMSPGGKVPVRRTIVERWRKHEVFSDYSEDLPGRLAQSMDGLKRWGWREGMRSPLIAPIYARKVFPTLVGEVLDGRLDPAEAGAWVEREIQGLERALSP